MLRSPLAEPPNYELEREMIVGVQTRNSRASVASAWRPQSIALKTGAGSDDDEPTAAAASGGRRKSKAYLYKGSAELHSVSKVGEKGVLTQHMHPRS